MNEDCVYVLSKSNEDSFLENVLSKEDQDYSIYICDLNDIISKCNLWKQLFPRIQPFYAVKTNNHYVVLQVMASLGINFDCASKNEIKKILDLGVDPSKIIFAHTCKSTSSLKYAYENNVKLMTFDCKEELRKIKSNFPDAETVIRIKHDDASAKCKLGIKFGCDAYSEAEKLLKAALKENVNVVGVSFHIGSESNDPFVFYEAMKDARYVFQIAANLGFNFDLLDIGGGYPGTRDDAIFSYCEHINKGLEDYFPDKSIRIISEPGTFFAKSAFTLATCINLVREKNIADDYNRQTVNYEYFINDGVFGSFSTVTRYNFRFIPRPLKASGKTLFLSTLWGPTCNSLDKVADDVVLPKMKTGEWLIFDNIGSYSQVVSTNFNELFQNKIYNIISYENLLKLRKKWSTDYCDFSIIN